MVRWLLARLFPGYLRTRAAERVRAGTAALATEEYEDAVRAFGAAVRDLEAGAARANPVGLLEPLSGWSIALSMLRRHPEAMAVAERTLQLAQRTHPDETPQMRTALFNLAHVLDRGCELRDAIAVQERLVRCSDELERDHSLLRALYEEAGEYDRLRAFAEADVHVRPASIDAWSCLGVAHLRLGQLEDASKAFEQAWQLSFDSYRGGGDWLCARNLAQLEVVREHWEDAPLWLARAEALVVEALAGQPMPLHVLSLLAETRAGLHLGTGAVAEARAVLEGLESPEPTRADRLALLRAEVAWREGDREEAAEQARDVVRWYAERGVPDHQRAHGARRYLAT